MGRKCLISLAIAQGWPMDDDEPDGTEEAQYLVRCVNVDRDDIQEEYCRVSADLAYWGERSAEAEEAYILAKAALARARANAGEVVRTSGGKATDAAVKDRVERSEQVHTATIRYAKAAGDRVRYRGIVTSISIKAEMLVSLGATQRKEMTPSPVLRTRPTTIDDDPEDP